MSPSYPPDRVEGGVVLYDRAGGISTRKSALAMIADGWGIVSFPETRYMKAGYSLVRDGQASVMLSKAVGNWLVDTGVFTRDVEQAHRLTGPISYTKAPAVVTPAPDYRRLAASMTPGPWCVDDDDAGIDGLLPNRTVISAPTWHCLASVVVRMEDDDRDRAEGRANAKAIAALPDLIAAAREMVASDAKDDGYGSALCALEAALAKAGVL